MESDKQIISFSELTINPLAVEEFRKINSMFRSFDDIEAIEDPETRAVASIADEVSLVAVFWKPVTQEHIDLITSWIEDSTFASLRTDLLFLLVSKENLMHLLERFSFPFALKINDVLFQAGLIPFRDNFLAHLEEVLTKPTITHDELNDILKPDEFGGHNLQELHDVMFEARDPGGKKLLTLMQHCLRVDPEFYQELVQSLPCLDFQGELGQTFAISRSQIDFVLFLSEFSVFRMSNQLKDLIIASSECHCPSCKGNNSGCIQ